MEDDVSNFAGLLQRLSFLILRSTLFFSNLSVPFSSNVLFPISNIVHKSVLLKCTTNETHKRIEQ